MQLPCIHLNGTSKVSLITALCTASDALYVACKALRQTAPNGRDFYPLGPGAFSKAEEEHRSRLQRLDAIKAEIDALTIAINEIQ